jgi:hypothetical protein
MEGTTSPLEGLLEELLEEPLLVEVEVEDHHLLRIHHRHHCQTWLRSWLSRLSSLPLSSRERTATKALRTTSRGSSRDS